MRCLIEELGAERALVLLASQEPEGFAVAAAQGIQTEDFWTSGTVSTEVLRRVLRDGAPELLSDAQESDYGGRTSVVVSGLRSVLCVPVKDSDPQRVIGCLYADTLLHRSAFRAREMQRALNLARDLGAALHPSQEMPREVAAPERTVAEPVGPREAVPGRWPFLWMASAALLLLLVPLLWRAGSRQEGAERPPPPARTEEATRPADPVTVSRSFLVLLQLRMFHSAYQHLSARVRKDLPMEDFVRQLEAGMGKHRGDLKFRTVVPGHRVPSGDRKEALWVVRVEPSGPAGGQEVWTWTLCREDAQWRLDAMEAGPLVLPPSGNDP